MQGSLVADALTFDYEFRWREWMRNEIPVNEGNMHDPHGGGPALFWAMINIFDPSTHNLRGWVVPTGAFTTGYGTVGSFFYWTVTAQCMQMPNIFG